MSKKDSKLKHEEPVVGGAIPANEAETVHEDKAANPDSKETDPETYTLTKEEFEKTKTLLESLSKEKEEAIALLQRNQADFDNYRRRNASAKAESFEDGKRNVVKELLPILDNFDRAMEADSSSAGAWQDGVKMVHKQLLDTLSKLGLQEIDATGKFDPSVHNAVLSEKAEDKESGEILLVLQKGYRMGDAILRHSMVKVNE